jgi:hypothetical protein
MYKSTRRGGVLVQRIQRWIGLLVLVGALLLAVGCSVRPLIYDVSVTPNVISPNADGVSDVTRIAYSLGRNASLSIYIVDEQGERYYFRRDRARSRSLGRPYRVDFGGVIPISVNGFRQDRVLPDGRYTLVLEATDDRGKTTQIDRALTIEDADTTPPELQGFGLDRHVFTPNRDGVDDRVIISYYLTKEAETLVYLLDAEGQRYPIERDDSNSATKDGDIGPYYYDYEGGVDKGAEPPPDGLYTVVGYAEDKVGNKSTVTEQLEIKDGGVPRGTIVGLEWTVSDTVIPVGGTLYFTATVENYGTTPIRTTGPEPGTLYTTDWNAATLGYYERAGVFRFGIGFQNCPLGDYPWRWSLGRGSELHTVQRGDETLYYLMPGQRVLITGGIQILDPLPDKSTVFWAGLIHEQVEIVNARVDAKAITIDEEPTGAWVTRATPTPLVDPE